MAHNKHTDKFWSTSSSFIPALHGDFMETEASRTHNFKDHILASEAPDLWVSEGQNSDELTGIHIHQEETK